VERVTPAILGLAGAMPGSLISVGGMRTKLNAIRQVTEAGMTAVLARGALAPLQNLVKGLGPGTIFLPRAKRKSQA